MHVSAHVFMCERLRLQMTFFLLYICFIYNPRLHGMKPRLRDMIPQAAWL